MVTYYTNYVTICIQLVSDNTNMVYKETYTFREMRIAIRPDYAFYCVKI